MSEWVTAGGITFIIVTRKTVIEGKRKCVSCSFIETNLTINFGLVMSSNKEHNLGAMSDVTFDYYIYIYFSGSGSWLATENLTCDF
jgi:hypothetical protein